VATFDFEALKDFLNTLDTPSLKGDRRKLFAHEDADGLVHLSDENGEPVMTMSREDYNELLRMENPDVN
jgi:hypothetical protein